MEYKNFIIDNQNNGVVKVVIDRGPVNALSTEAYKELTHIFATFNEREDIRVAIITGSGRSFVAGSDVNEFKTLTPDISEKRNPVLLKAFQSIYSCKVPVIAAVNGYALGGGVFIAASSDIIVASERAVFGLPEINVGVMGGGSFLQRLVPHMKARMMMYTGRKLSAEDMYRFGSIEAVVPHDQLLDKAVEYANEIAEKSPVAIQMIKKDMNHIEFMEIFPGFEYEQKLVTELSTYEDSKEAARAFLEKRKPVFKGK